MILVPQVDVDRVDSDGPRRDDRAFEEAMRVALEIVRILERPRLAFVDVDRHQARSRFGCDDFPLAARWKAGAAETAQPRVFHHGDDIGRRLCSAEARRGENVTSRRPVCRVVDVPRCDRDVRRRMGGCPGAYKRDDFFGCRVGNGVLADDGDRRRFTSADAWRVKNADVRAER